MGAEIQTLKIFKIKKFSLIQFEHVISKLNKILI